MHSIIHIILPLMCLSLAPLIGCQRSADSQNKPVLYRVVPGPFKIMVEGRCELRSKEEFLVNVFSPVTIKREVRGLLSDMKIMDLVEEGSRIQKGQIVAQIGIAEANKLMDRLEAEVKIGQAALESAEKGLLIETSNMKSEVEKWRVQVGMREVDLNLAKLSPGSAKRLEAYVALDEAKLDVIQKQEELASFEYLGEKNLASEFQVFEKRLHYREAQNAIREKELQIQILRLGPEPRDIAYLELALNKDRLSREQAKNNLKYKIAGLKAEIAKAKKNLYRPARSLKYVREFIAETGLKAPESGIVLYRRIWSPGGSRKEKVKKGMRVGLGQTILAIQNETQMQAVMEIGESEIPLVREGQQAWVILDSLPGRQFIGQIAQIDKVARFKGEALDLPNEEEKEIVQEKVFEVIVPLSAPDQALKPGLTGTVKIVTQEFAKVITVPAQAIWKDGSHAFVALWKQGRPQRQAVVLGVTSQEYTIVSDGLQAGDEVVLTPPRLPVAVAQRRFSVPLTDGRRLELQEYGPALPKTFVHQLIETGTIYPKNAQEVAASIAGEIVSVVAEGAYVKPGDQILLIQKKEEDIEEILVQKEALEADLARQESELALAKKNQSLEVRKSQLDLEQAEFELNLLRQKPLPHEATKARLARIGTENDVELAQKILTVGTELAQKGLVSDAELSKRKLNLAKYHSLSLIAQLKEQIVLKGPAAEEIKMAEEKVRVEKLKYVQTQKAADSIIGQYQIACQAGKARIAEQEYQLSFAKEKSQKGIVYAPGAGYVRYHRTSWGKPEIGKQCYRGQYLLTIADESQLVVKTKVSEVDYRLVAVGAKAWVRIPAFPQKELPGKVIALSQVVIDRSENTVNFTGGKFSGVIVLEVTVEILAADPALKTGMSGIAEIVLYHLPSALAIPKNALVQDATGDYVYIIAHGQPHRQKITVGAANDLEIVVTSGLLPGQVLAVAKK